MCHNPSSLPPVSERRSIAASSPQLFPHAHQDSPVRRSHHGASALSGLCDPPRSRRSPARATVVTHYEVSRWQNSLAKLSPRPQPRWFIRLQLLPSPIPRSQLSRMKWNSPVLAHCVFVVRRWPPCELQCVLAAKESSRGRAPLDYRDLARGAP